jgi:hypothetical protein
MFLKATAPQLSQPRSWSPAMTGHFQIRPSVALRFVLCLLVSTVFAIPSRVVGQATEFGEINGTVTDSSGGVISKAEVTATNLGTNEPTQVKTNGADSTGCSTFFRLSTR